jgi:hypothetical protein
LASLSGSSLALSAQFTGKITESNGKTPIAGIPVYVYQYNAASGTFLNVYVGSPTSGPDGSFIATLTAAPAAQIGVYLLSFGDFSTLYQLDPFGEYGSSYSPSPAKIYYSETFDGVTAKTPTKAPTLLTVKTSNVTVDLKTIKLDKKTQGCVISGPLTVNGTSYSSFSTFGSPPNAPVLPETGGSLVIGFNVLNLGSTPIKTNLQTLAFLSRRNQPALLNARSALPFGKQTVTVAKGTTKVKITATIPKGVMPGTPPPSAGDHWAFNVGIQAQDAATGLANCFTLATFPVAHAGTGSSVSTAVAEQPGTEIIPLELSEDGKVLRWGPRPLTE